MIDTHLYEKEKLDEKETLIALLPFYLSGTLDKDERAQVEAWLQSDPEAGVIMEKIDLERHANMQSNEQISLPKDGLARLMADVAQTEQEKTLKSQGFSLLGALDRMVLGPLKAAPSEMAWAACGLMLLVTIGQSTLLYQGAGTPKTGPGIELASGERYQFLSMAVIKFKDDAAMSAIADVLDEAGAVIIDGPTARGHFTIGFVKREGAPALEQRQRDLQSNDKLIGFFALKQADK